MDQFELIAYEVQVEHGAVDVRFAPLEGEEIIERIPIPPVVLRSIYLEIYRHVANCVYNAEVTHANQFA